MSHGSGALNGTVEAGAKGQIILVILGARVPIILTSRADSVRSRVASSAVAMRVAHARRKVR